MGIFVLMCLLSISNNKVKKYETKHVDTFKGISEHEVNSGYGFDSPFWNALRHHYVWHNVITSLLYAISIFSVSSDKIN